LGNGGKFREASFNSEEHFNPTNAPPPFFQIFHPEFLAVLGSSPSIRLIASSSRYAFAHEAPVWIRDTDEFFFSSDAGGSAGLSSINLNNEFFKISLKDVDAAMTASGSTTAAAVNVTATKLDLPDTIQMTNGATGPFRGSLVLINSGRGPLPPSIALVNPAEPHNVTMLLDNYYGRQFNSLNDIKVHPKSGKLFFTDVTYGYLNKFRSDPLFPNQVYRFDPDTGSVRVVADGFAKPNGIAFTKDGKTAYIADSGAARGFLGLDQTEPTTIYAFDVDPKSQAFTNRRVLAYAETGAPDGVQVDTKGNVYVSCGDGVHVWNPEGTLIGKFFTGKVSANLAFAGDGRLVILAEDAIYLAQIAAGAVDLSYE